MTSPSFPAVGPDNKIQERHLPERLSDTALTEKIQTTAEALIEAGKWSGIDDIGTAIDTLTLSPGEVGGIKAVTLAGATRFMLPISDPGVMITLVITQGAGGPHDVVWPGNIAWQSGTAPTLSEAAGLADVVTLMCVNGLAWIGFVSGEDINIPEKVIKDSFNRPNSNILLATDTGQPWIESGWSISSNRLQATAGGESVRAAVDTGQSEDVEVSVKALTGGQDSFCYLTLHVRESADARTKYRLQWQHLFNANQAKIFRIDGASIVQMGANFSLNAKVGDQIGFRFEMVEGVATVHATVNGAVVQSRTDASPLPAGNYVSVGNLGPTLSVAHVDDFRVSFL